MTLPGADTINAGIIGLDCFLSRAILPFFFVPLICVLAIPSLTPLTPLVPLVPLVRGGISRRGEVEGLESEGVSIARLVVLDPEREWVFVVIGCPPNDLLVVLVIA